MISKPRILLVDDIEENLVALEAILRRDDCELLSAHSGREALELLLVEDVALALIDVHMPEMDGFEVAELMRGTARTNSIPIIFVTASVSDQARLFKGYESGAVDFLLKPLDPNVLRSKVEVFLQLHRQKQQLAERVRELEAVLAAVPAAVFLTRDVEARHIEANRFAHEILAGSNGTQPGDPPEAGLGAPLRLIRRGREIPAGEQPVQMAAAEGVEVRDYDFELVLKDGTTLHLFGNATPMRDLEGRVLGAVAAFVDITELKRAEARLRELDRRKDDFLAVLSHELRNPLMPIRTSLYLLHRAPPGGEQAQRAMEVMERQVGHLARLVDDLLDVTRMTRGKFQLQREPADLVEIVRRTVEDHRSAFLNSGIDLAVRLPKEPLMIEGDATRIAQVVGNLLANANKFTPAGGSVRVYLERGEDDARLTVRDDGLGISPEILGRLFEPFAQGDRTLDRSRGGLGLGLALVKSLTEMHGGAVEVRSDGPGRGSEFVVRLPLGNAFLRKSPEAERSTAGGERLRVLVVEDNADGAATLREAIEMIGHEVEVAADGPSALALARLFRPNVILCDIGLPGIDGYEVARRIKRDPDLRSARLVAITGYALPEDRQKALEAGFSDHISKPPEPATLERLLPPPARSEATSS